jgi:hypothetical protein
MTPFYLGIACGAVLIAAVVLIGGHVAMEIADGRLVEF